MKAPRFHTIRCPERTCKTPIRVPIVYGTDDRGRTVVVTIDPTPLRDHVQKVHGNGTTEEKS